MRTKNIIKAVIFNPKTLSFQTVAPEQIKGLNIDEFTKSLSKDGLKVFTTALERGTQKYFSPSMYTGNKVVNDFIKQCTDKGLNTDQLFWDI